MTKPLKTPLGRGVLALIAAAALIALGLRAGTAHADPDGPRADRNERIAGLAAEVSLMKVECAAARENLMKSLKKLGNLRLSDNRQTLESIGADLEKIKSQVMLMAVRRGEDTKAMLDGFRASLAKGGGEVPGENDDLFQKFAEGGDGSEKAADALAKLELKTRVDLAAAETDRMRADFLEKCRSLHLKKLELAEAEGRSGK